MSSEKITKTITATRGQWEKIQRILDGRGPVTNPYPLKPEPEKEPMPLRGLSKKLEKF